MNENPLNSSIDSFLWVLLPTTLFFSTRIPADSAFLVNRVKYSDQLETLRLRSMFIFKVELMSDAIALVLTVLLRLKRPTIGMGSAPSPSRYLRFNSC